MNDFDRDRENGYPVISYLKTGVRIPYPSKFPQYQTELVEWKCPACCHRWFEYSDAAEYPTVCPLCGLDLD